MNFLMQGLEGFLPSTLGEYNTMSSYCINGKPGHTKTKGMEACTFADFLLKDEGIDNS